MSNKSVFVGICALAGLASTAAAETFTGATRMLFSSPVGELGGTLNANLSNAAAPGGVSTFSHGTPFGSSTQNVLTFDGANSFSALDEAEFVLGDLNYLNGQTVAGSAATGITASLAVTFTGPVGINPPNTTFIFQWEFTLTPNTTGNPVTDGDILSVVNPTASQTFSVGSTTYTLQILGFRTPDAGGALTSTWLLPEDTDIDGVMVGRFTTNVIPLPTAAAMSMAGLIALGLVRRR